MVEIVHPLKLDKTNCGKDVISVETHADLELDLSTFTLPVVEEKKEIKKMKEEKIPPRELSMEEKIIKEAITKFPLVDEKIDLPYLHAKDLNEFVS
jgi:hypothetical protein